MALSRPTGRDAVTPSRSLSGLALASVVMVSSLLFGANLVRFATTPTRYGWRWDAMISPASAEPTVVAAAASKLAHDPSVGTVVQGLFGQIQFGGYTVPAVALGHGERETSVVITGGRGPVSDDEVVLGRTTLNSLHTAIGATILATTTDATSALKVVGTGVFPRFAPYESSEPTGLGVGAAVTLEGLDALGHGDLFGAPFLLASAAPGHKLDAAVLSAELFAGDQAAGLRRGTFPDHHDIARVAGVGAASFQTHRQRLDEDEHPHDERYPQHGGKGGAPADEHIANIIFER